MGSTIFASFGAWLQAINIREVIGFIYVVITETSWLFSVGFRLAGYRDCRSHEAAVRSEAVCAGQRLVRQQGGQEVSGGGTVTRSSDGGDGCSICTTNKFVHVAKVYDAETFGPVSP